MMSCNVCAPYFIAFLILVKLALLTERPRLFVGSKGSMMFRNLTAKNLLLLGTFAGLSEGRGVGLYMLSI